MPANLCLAILALSVEPWVAKEVEEEAFQRLGELDLAVYGADGWELTWAGKQLVDDVVDGNPPEL